MAKFLEEFHKNYKKITDSEVITALEAAEKQMNIAANAQLLKVQRAVGLRPQGKGR